MERPGPECEDRDEERDIEPPDDELEVEREELRLPDGRRLILYARRD